MTNRKQKLIYSGTVVTTAIIATALYETHGLGMFEGAFDFIYLFIGMPTFFALLLAGFCDIPTFLVFPLIALGPHSLVFLPILKFDAHTGPIKLIVKQLLFLIIYIILNIPFYFIIMGWIGI